MKDDLDFELTILPSAPAFLSNEAKLRCLKRLAARNHRQYPQYDGHWDGPEWVLVKVTRTIRTKMGVAFKRGETALGRPSGMGWTVYSVSNRCNTAVPTKNVTVY